MAGLSPQKNMGKPGATAPGPKPAPSSKSTPVGNAAKAVGKTIGNVAKTVGKTVGNTAKTIGKTVGPVIKNEIKNINEAKKQNFENFKENIKNSENYLKIRENLSNSVLNPLFHGDDEELDLGHAVIRDLKGGTGKGIQKLKESADPKQKLLGDALNMGHSVLFRNVQNPHNQEKSNPYSYLIKANPLLQHFNGQHLERIHKAFQYMNLKQKNEFLKKLKYTTNPQDLHELQEKINHLPNYKDVYDLLTKSVAGKNDMNLLTKKAEVLLNKIQNLYPNESFDYQLDLAIEAALKMDVNIQEKISMKQANKIQEIISLIAGADANDNLLKQALSDMGYNKNDILQAFAEGPGHRFTKKQDELAEQIAKEYEKKGKSPEEAKSIGYATVVKTQHANSVLKNLSKKAENDIFGSTDAVEEVGELAEHELEAEKHHLSCRSLTQAGLSCDCKGRVNIEAHSSLKRKACGCWNSPECGCDTKDVDGLEGHGEMAKNQIKSLVRDTQELEQAIMNAGLLPDWVESKLSIATDYIQTIKDYLQSEQEG